jgi:hypothetical protein
VLLGFGVEGHEAQQRQVAPGVVMAVEEGELLLPVRGIVGGIEVDGDQPSASLEPGAMLADDQIGQRVAQPRQRQGTDGILEAREGGLGSQGGPGERIAVQQPLVDGVVGQPRGIVAVGVATDQPEDPLADEFQDLVLDFAGLAPVPETTGDSRGDPELLIEGLEQHRAPIGAAVLGIELRDHKLVESERDLGYTVCSHRASSSLCAEASCQPSFRTLRGLDGSFVSSFAHNPG